MGRMLLNVLAVFLLAVGCHQARPVSSRLAPDDIVGVYARQRGITREQAELSIQREAAAARANAASSPATTPTTFP
jgi:hypothetical protein